LQDIAAYLRGIHDSARRRLLEHHRAGWQRGRLALRKTWGTRI